MTLRTSLTILALAAGAPACRLIPQATPPPPASAPAPPPVPTAADCGAIASALAPWVGAVPTAEANAEIAARAGDRAVRTYTEGSPVTMDFNPARLNVELAGDGRIKRFWCG